jgi:hypothetical protein
MYLTVKPPTTQIKEIIIQTNQLITAIVPI